MKLVQLELARGLSGWVSAWETKRAKVLSVHRIENRMLWKQYWHRRNELIDEHPGQLRVLYVVDQPSRPGWRGARGYISKEMLRDYMPDPFLGPITKVLVCGPPAMVKHLAGELPGKKGQGEFGGLLKEVGFEASQVFKF